MGGWGRLGVAVVILAAAGAGAFWFITAPQRVDAATASAVASGDVGRGEQVFWAGGCASCHAAAGAQGEQLLSLGGGRELKTAFGTFVTPNISQDAADGIGGWTAVDLANAMLKGTSPDGSHFYPAFPYASYARMTPQDVGDLYAYLKTLPAVTGRAGPHRLGFPFTLRRGIGLWKLLYVSDEPVVALQDGAPDPLLRGRYLVEGPGHCGECHTPRDPAGGTKKDAWLSGAVAAEGDGVVPNITPGEGGIGGWSASEIAYYLESGFTPEFDSVGGSMAEVQKNMARLPASDREAIAAYLKTVPPHPNGYPPRQPSPAAQ